LVASFVTMLDWITAVPPRGRGRSTMTRKFRQSGSVLNVKSAFITIVAITVASNFVSSSALAQQQCSERPLVGRATSYDTGEAFRDANFAWQNEATTRMRTRTVFRANPRTTCKLSSTNAYTCAVSARACTKPIASKTMRVLTTRSYSWQGYDPCERCHYNPVSGGTDCRPICM